MAKFWNAIQRKRLNVLRCGGFWYLPTLIKRHAEVIAHVVIISKARVARLRKAGNAANC